MPEKLGARNVPPRYRGCTFENFDAYTPALRAKKNLLQRLATAKLVRGIFLAGPVGTGKSHLAVATLVEQLLQRRTGQFVRGMEFIARCRDSFRADESVAGIVNDLLDSDVLVFDDLGTEKQSEFTRESLTHLFDEAYCAEKTVIITSNLSLDQIGAMEPRIASRIAEMCTVFEMAGEDFRVRIARHKHASVGNGTCGFLDTPGNETPN